LKVKRLSLQWNRDIINFKEAIMKRRKKKKEQKQEEVESGTTYGVDMTDTWEIRAKIREQLDKEEPIVIDGPGIRKFKALKNTKLKI
jgi:NAD(P)H-hydrate repair Nnr-like enzyme with NAD(P)H-hydrate dehydratase domain